MNKDEQLLQEVLEITLALSHRFLSMLNLDIITNRILSDEKEDPISFLEAIIIGTFNNRVDIEVEDLSDEDFEKIVKFFHVRETRKEISKNEEKEGIMNSHVKILKSAIMDTFMLTVIKHNYKDDFNVYAMCRLLMTRDTMQRGALLSAFEVFRVEKLAQQRSIPISKIQNDLKACKPCFIMHEKGHLILKEIIELTENIYQKLHEIYVNKYNNEKTGNGQIDLLMGKEEFIIN